MIKAARWAALAAVLLLLAGCAAPAASDWPAAGDTLFGNQPQGMLSVFDNPLALAPEGGDSVFYVDRQTGALIRADRAYADPRQIDPGEVTGLACDGDALFYARVTPAGAGVRSEIVKTDRAGENPLVIFTTDRRVRQFLLADHLLYFVAENDQTSELWRLTERGDGLLTVAGNDLPVGDYTLRHSTVWFGSIWTAQWNDTAVYRTSISGGEAIPQGFRRGGPLFTVGNDLFAAVPYDDHLFLLQTLDPDGQTDEPYLLEEGGGMVSALWFCDRWLYFALPNSLNLYRLDRQSRETVCLYQGDEDGNCFAGMALAAGRLVLRDAAGGQYLVDPDAAAVTLAPLPLP